MLTKKLLAVPLLALAFTATAQAFSPPDTTDQQIITGEGHQVTATWRSTEPSHFHCWLSGKRRLPCTPPYHLDGLAPGSYELHVRAFGNESGLYDKSPAVGTFRIAP